MPAELSTDSPLMNRIARAAALLTACAVFWNSQPSAGTSALGQAPAEAQDEARTGLEAPPVLAAPKIDEAPVGEVPANEVPAPPGLPEVAPADEAASELTREVTTPAVRPASPTVSVPAAARVQQQLPPPVAKEWVVQISPAPQKPALLVQGRSYAQVYESIPFRQAEYLANPGYRHEATMEILFGQMRPTTVVKQYTPKTIENPAPGLSRPYLGTPSDYYAYPWSGYMFPNAFFPYPGFPGVLAPPLTF